MEALGRLTTQAEVLRVISNDFADADALLDGDGLLPAGRGCRVLGGVDQTYRAVDLRMSSPHAASKATGTRITGRPPVSDSEVWVCTLSWVGEPLAE
jgi:hypothetical protein